MDLIPKKFYLDDIFDDFLTMKEKNDMKCDIYEKDNKYYIEMDIPGFNKEDIKISVNNNYLTVTALKDSESDDKTKNYIRRERMYNKYQRSFYVGNINENEINAKFNHGTLIVNFPKEIEENNQKYIEIE